MTLMFEPIKCNHSFSAMGSRFKPKPADGRIRCGTWPRGNNCLSFSHRTMLQIMDFQGGGGKPLTLRFDKSPELLIHQMQIDEQKLT